MYAWDEPNKISEFGEVSPGHSSFGSGRLGEFLWHKIGNLGCWPCSSHSTIY